MILRSFLIFLVPALSGVLMVHLLWMERNGRALLVKLFLGTGLGLGLNSLVYLLVLKISPIQKAYFVIQIFLLILLLGLVIRRERWSGFKVRTVSALQWLLLSAAAVAVMFSALAFLNLISARPQGARDAWSIWNRASRFIYRDPQNWTATLAPELYWATHADYPLLVPVNVAWGWEAANSESYRIPIMHGAVFVFATIGLLFASLTHVRSVGQASLAVIVLASAGVFIDTGYAQISDVPLGFFILASSVCLYLYFNYENPALLVFSGFAAGLGAWTKNEGMLFVVVSLGTLLLWAGHGNRIRIVAPYLKGLAFPLIIVLYFKLLLAPQNDIFAQGDSGILAKLLDISRHQLILAGMYQTLDHYALWRINFPLAFIVYAIIMKPDIPTRFHRGSLLVAGTILLQIAGYYGIYLITPHDLEWHVSFSFGRLFFHVFPALLFLYFASLTEPEKVFSRVSERSIEVELRKETSGKIQ